MEGEAQYHGCVQNDTQLQCQHGCEIEQMPRCQREVDQRYNGLYERWENSSSDQENKKLRGLHLD